MNEDKEIQKSLESIVLYRVDCEQGEGIELAKQFNVRAYPTFALVNSKGETIDRWLGYAKDFYLKTLGKAMVDLSTVSEKQARYDSKPTAPDAAALGRYASATSEYKKAVELYTFAEKHKKNAGDDYTYEIFDNMADGIRKEQFTFDDVLGAADKALKSPNSSPKVAISLAQTMVPLAKKYERMPDIGPYLKSALDVCEKSDNPDLKGEYDGLMVSYALYIEKDDTKAVKHKKASMSEGWQDDSGQLNAFSWWCFENNINLEEAEKLSRKSVELAEPGKSKAMCLDTLAEICNSLKNCHEAVELTRMAIAEDPDSEFYPRQLTRFEELLASQN